VSTNELTITFQLNDRSSSTLFLCLSHMHAQACENTHTYTIQALQTRYYISTGSSIVSPSYIHSKHHSSLRHYTTFLWNYTVSFSLKQCVSQHIYLKTLLNWMCLIYKTHVIFIQEAYNSNNKKFLPNWCWIILNKTWNVHQVTNCPYTDTPVWSHTWADY